MSTTPRPWAVFEGSTCMVIHKDGSDGFAGIIAMTNGKTFFDKSDAALIVKAVNTHERAVKAIKELLIYAGADNELRVHMYPQSIEFAKSVLTDMEG